MLLRTITGTIKTIFASLLSVHDRRRSLVDQGVECAVLLRACVHASYKNWAWSRINVSSGTNFSRWFWQTLPKHRPTKKTQSPIVSSISASALSAALVRLSMSSSRSRYADSRRDMLAVPLIHFWRLLISHDCAEGSASARWLCSSKLSSHRTIVSRKSLVSGFVLLLPYSATATVNFSIMAFLEAFVSYRIDPRNNGRSSCESNRSKDCSSVVISSFLSRSSLIRVLVKRQTFCKAGCKARRALN